MPMKSLHFSTSRRLPGGGAKRSTQTAALGGKKTIGTGLSASEMDALRGQISKNWSMVAGLTDVAPGGR